jgi:cysteine-S-conjugate beta-lyase
MIYDFDTLIDRRHSDCEKWNHFATGVLPLWVADMDFRSPQPVIDALHAAVEHGVFGYGCDPVALREVFVERLFKRYGWSVSPEAVIFLPGVARGFHLACRVFASPGDGVLIQPPVYPPILKAHSQAGLVSNEADLTRGPDGAYSIDLDAFESAINQRTRLFLLCNPHNPVGRAFQPDELEAMARVCLKNNVLICSDEIHCDLIFSGYRHIPIASLSPEIADRTITLMAPSKTFNIPGLKLSVAIITNPDVRKDYVAMQSALTGGPNVLAVAAAMAAYRDSQDWLDQALAYLQANRDYVYEYVSANLPMLNANKPEATFLSWIDCRQASISSTSPCQFFIDKGRVALNDGASFGHGGEGFVRLNFGCPRATLTQALEQMQAALESM